MSIKTKDDLKIDHINIKSFTEEEIFWLENNQETFKYMKKMNKVMQHSIQIKQEAWLKANAITDREVRNGKMELFKRTYPTWKLSVNLIKSSALLMMIWGKIMNKENVISIFKC